ncbi:hypothetical protein BX600DRAFT_554619 [Xylariales sp. PMI_506]|nr:hypothetical protein BX600DRAFT_554619 [Xylariales sp. PMI_506]
MAFIRLYRDSDFEDCGHICRETLPASLSASPLTAKLAPYLWTHPYTHLSPATCHVLDDGTGRAVGYCIGCPDVFAMAAAYASYAEAVLARDIDIPTPAAAPPHDGDDDNGGGAGAGAGGGEGKETEAREPWVIPEGRDGAGAVNPGAMAQIAWNPALLLLDGNDHLTARWRGTMHIDLLEPFQGRGWGRALIDRFVESVHARSTASSSSSALRPDPLSTQIGLDHHHQQEQQQDSGRGIWIRISGENDKVVPFYEKVGFRLLDKELNALEDGHTIPMVRDV